MQAYKQLKQLEHFLMEGKSKISWTEGYGALQGSPELLHGKDFAEAIDEVKSNIGDKQILVEEANFNAEGKGEINHLGVTLYTAGDVEGAYDAFLKSVQIYSNAWAFRNLAQIEKNEKKKLVKAVEYMERAIAEKTDYQPLWVNYAESLFAVKDYAKWVEIYEKNIPEDIKPNGRILMLYSLALVEVDRYLDALEILKNDFVLPDIKEGEFSISHIWLKIHRKMMRADGLQILLMKRFLTSIHCHMN